MATPKEIAIQIWEDVSDRRGFGLKCLRYDDPEIWLEIIEAWAKLIEAGTKGEA